VNTTFGSTGLILSGLANNFEFIYKKVYKLFQFVTTGGKKPMNELSQLEQAVRRIIRSSQTFSKIKGYIEPLIKIFGFLGKAASKVFKILLPLEAIYHFLVGISKTKDGMLSVMYTLDKLVESLSFGKFGLGD